MKDLATIIRQLNIDIITDTHNPIIEWFNDLWARLSIVEIDVYHQNGGEFVYYYIIDGKKHWVFFQDNKRDKFWCDFEGYWSILESKFKYNSYDIQIITKFLVENALDNSVSTPNLEPILLSEKVENALDNSVSTPSPLFIDVLRQVENALDNSVSTPVFSFGKWSTKVENALNK